MVGKHLEISNGKSILSPINKTMIQTDASQKGWGAYCQNMSIGGQWTSQESRLNINLLELNATLQIPNSLGDKFSH